MRSVPAIIVWSALSLGAFGCGGGSSPTSPSDATTGISTGANPATTSATWNFNGSTWSAVGTAPACPSPLNLSVPVDLSKVTSILYPGQVRGDFKPHGGFRFDLPGQTNDVAVTSPISGVIYRGARYRASGEPQYTFDIMNACGIMTRLGHLRDLSPRFAALADALPDNGDGDSRTTNFAPGLTVALGEGIATAVGVRSTSNVFLDWGVYDLRQRNASSNDPAWAAAHPGDVALYGICWFDQLSPANTAIVRSLPSSDSVMGKTSDFCR